MKRVVLFLLLAVALDLTLGAVLLVLDRRTLSGDRGGLVNYGVYALCVRLLGQMAFPVIGVALGSLAGLCVNYIASRRFVFNRGVKCA